MSLMLVRFKFSANIGMMCFVVYVGCLFLLSGLVGWLFCRFGLGEGLGFD